MGLLAGKMLLMNVNSPLLVDITFSASEDFSVEMQTRNTTFTKLTADVYRHSVHSLEAVWKLPLD
jgi:hypothetical protein